MPAINFAKRADDQRRGDHAGVDAEIEDLEGVGAAVVLGAVERADLARDIALEHARAEDEAEEGEEEGQLERHQGMPGGHSDGPEQHGAELAEPAVGEPAAEDGRAVAGLCMGGQGGGCEGLVAEARVEPAEMAEYAELL